MEPRPPGLIKSDRNHPCGVDVPAYRSPSFTAPDRPRACASVRRTVRHVIIALEKLIGLLNPAEISGTVIIVPLVNIPSFERKVPHVNPVDGVSMNRMYPGKMEGTQTDRASYLITRQVVEQADHLIDFHGGDLEESLRQYSYWTRTGNENQDRISKEMVLAFGLDHIIISTDRPKIQTLRDIWRTLHQFEESLRLPLKPGILDCRAGRSRRFVDGSLSVMRYLKMLRPSTIEHPVWIENFTIPSDQPESFTRW